MGFGRILLVDDERLFRELFRDALEGRGYEVAVASSGPEALALLAADRADLLVTDLRMPGMDGIELVSEALRRDPGMEAIAVTAADDLETAVRAMQAGCADFLVKPVEDEQLARSVVRALGRARVRREHARLLDENLEFVRSQSLFHQGLAILGTLDSERLVDLVLQVLSRVTDAQGAALWLADERRSLQLRGYRGLVDRSLLPPRVDPGEGEWSPRILAGAPFPVPGTPPGQAFYAPLLADDEPMGLLYLADRARGRFGDEEQAAAAALCRFAAIAARNARRVQQLERVGLRDKETGAYNLAYFVDTAGKEFYKARRYGRAFSLAVLAVDNVDAMRREGGRDAYRAAVRGIVAAVARATRDADVVAKVAEGEYYVLLPETDYFGMRIFARRAAEEVAREPSVAALSERCPPLLALGAATFPRDGEDFDELLHHARLRQQEDRGSMVRRLQLGELGPSAFWELADLLLAPATPIPDTSPSARRPADAEIFAAAQREAAREIGRDPRARGLLYVGVRGGAAAAPVLAALPPADGLSRAGDTGAHVVVLGSRGGVPGDPRHPLLSMVWLDGERRLRDHQFLLFLAEHSAFALLEGPDGSAFHTADAPLVDALVSRLAALHELEPG